MNFDILQVTLLALIQGVTEFLPISSSAHLILPAALLGWEDQGLAFDMAVHLGTLLAVVFYFRRDLYEIIAAMLVQVGTGKSSAPSTLGWHLVLATIPVLIGGLLLQDLVETSLRSVTVIALTTIVYGGLLWVADRYSTTTRSMLQLNWKISLVIGLSQVLALVPGTSRSGITMTAALFCHLDRQAAARFSFLLSIPVTAAAALLVMLELLDAPSVDWLELCYALVVAALTAFACIHYFLKLISSLGFLPFVIYRVLLGSFLLLFFVF
jgi:undecaprenyl-diphosphatase